jgi:hypothetical protein
MRLKAYENASISKEKIKRWYEKRLKKKEFKKGDKVLHNSRFKTFGKGELQSKWDGPYVAHSVLSNGAVTIMDVKGDQFMVNNQRLKDYYEPDVVPLRHIDVFTRTPIRRGEDPYSRSKLCAHPRHEEEGLQGGAART